MGRPKKEVEVVSDVDSEVNVERAVESEVKKPLIKVSTKYTAYDIDGNKTLVSNEAEDVSAEGAIAKINLLKGLNCNVNVTLNVGEVELTRFIPPVKVRAIFENKNVAVLKAVFRGLL